jgi:sodium/hydrogen antiporter
MIDWFGIRGIGSVFYSVFYLPHLGVDGRIADTLVSLTLWTVAASIVAHGLTAQPLMPWYELWRSRAKERRPRAPFSSRGRRRGADDSRRAHTP